MYCICHMSSIFVCKDPSVIDAGVQKVGALLSGWANFEIDKLEKIVWFVINIFGHRRKLKRNV